MSTLFIVLVIALVIAYFMQMDWMFMLTGGSFIAGGVIVLVGQMYAFLDLQHGVWTPKPLLDFMQSIAGEGSSFYTWAENPQSMQGLHSFAVFMPLALSLMIVGFLLSWYYSSR